MKKHKHLTAKTGLITLGILTLLPAALAGSGRLEISQDMIPLTITNSGSYVVTENIKATFSGGTLISVLADNVTIDLNGFRLRGGGMISGSGIYQSPANRNLCVFNGTVENCNGGLPGALAGIKAEGCGNIIRDITASYNQLGILSREASIIADCTVSSNQETGIVADDGSTVENCTSVGNTYNGFALGKGCILRNCTAKDNGYNGISLANGCVVETCSARDNARDGIIAAEGCVITDASVSHNASNGIFVGTGSGIYRSNSHNNHKAGFIVPEQNVLFSSIATDNDNSGIIIGNGCLVHDCSTVHNIFYGFWMTGLCSRISHCLSRDNFTQGYFLSPQTRAVELTHCQAVDNGTSGFYISGDSNIVVRNTASESGSEFTFTGTGCIEGIITNSAIISSYPWANFTY